MMRMNVWLVGLYRVEMTKAAPGVKGVADGLRINAGQ